VYDCLTACVFYVLGLKSNKRRGNTHAHTHTGEWARRLADTGDLVLVNWMRDFGNSAITDEARWCHRGI